MSFDDEYLRRLKASIADSTYIRPSHVDVLLNKLPDLLSRLDAAEECAGLLKVHYEAGTFDGADELDNTLAGGALRDWLKSAGKPQGEGKSE